jgi:hypothetical protein
LHRFGVPRVQLHGEVLVLKLTEVWHQRRA